MQTYRLVYPDDRFGPAKWVEFEARSATGALEIAGEEARGRWARLFEDGRFICCLERIDPDGDNIWVISSASLWADDLLAALCVEAGAADRDRSTASAAGGRGKNSSTAGA